MLRRLCRGSAAVLAITLVCTATSSAETSTGELILGAGQQERPALLLESELRGRVDGLVLSMTLTQRFQNESEEWVNGRYVFPLPETAAVDSLTLRTDGRILRGRVREREEAKREYAAAKSAGKRAGLLQQNRPNLFSMAIANIAPGAVVSAEITWVDTVRYDEGRFVLRLPTTLTPRYIPGRELGEDAERVGVPLRIAAGSGWARDTDQVPDASAITPPQFRPDGGGHDEDAAGRSLSATHRFRLDLELHAGLPLAAVSSPTHAFVRGDDGADPVVASIHIADAPLDRDVVLEWSPTPGAEPRAAVFRQQVDGEGYQLTMLMPPSGKPARTLPREVIFIIDSSGSMAGVSMERARQGLHAALAHLDPGDRFNIIDFDSDARALFRHPREASVEALHHAARFVNSLEADGGTEMLAALDLAFAQPRESGRLHQVVFITDGSVGNEQALFERIRRGLGDARLFTVGIGSAPNAHFMRGAAQHGRGLFLYIDSAEVVSGAMATLFRRIGSPLMRDIDLSWEPRPGAVDFYPSRIPDLYAGEPLMVLSRGAPVSGSLTVSGVLAESPWSRTIDFSSAPEATHLDKLWARRRIEDLESGQVIRGRPMDEIRDELVALGTRHQLLNRYTAFVAVDETPVRPVDASGRDRDVPNRMPAGNTMSVPMPRTATSAALLQITGAVLLLLAAILYRRRPLVPA